MYEVQVVEEGWIRLNRGGFGRESGDLVGERGDGVGREVEIEVGGG